MRSGNPLVLIFFAIFSSTATAGHNEDSTIWITGINRAGWVNTMLWIQSPTGPGDYFNVAHDVVGGDPAPNVEEVVEGMLISGIAVNVVDLAQIAVYARVGVYYPSACDPTGNTPDLSPSGTIAELLDPNHGAVPPFTWVGFDLPQAPIAPGTIKVHAVVQLPPTDPGTLGVGADSTSAPAGTSFFTTDGYGSCPSPPNAVGLDLGINIGQDNSSTTSCKASARRPHGRLRASTGSCAGIDVGSGDRLTVDIHAGDSLNLAFFGTKTGDKFRLYFNVMPCSPAVAIGPVLPTIPDADGDGTYLRINTLWPSGFGGNTFRFSAVWGNPACANPGVGFTNCVTMVVRQDPNTFGVMDDGVTDSGWTVSPTSGPSDYFNVNFGHPHGVSSVDGLEVSVWGPLTSGSFPQAGLSNANLAADATGNTPDVGNALGLITPFTFSAGQDSTAPYVVRPFPSAILSSSLGTCVHGWVQFPPGDPGLLQVGADTDSGSNETSFQSSNGYSMPPSMLPWNHGIRLVTSP